jgi:riboflavin synthase alpha subunit
MYTGRIVEIGEVVEPGHQLVIRAPKAAGQVRPGGSLSVAGVCLTVEEIDESRIRVQVSAETALRTTVGHLPENTPVNFELPLKVGDPLDGHLVQGHVDALGKVTRVDADEPVGRRIWIRPPARFLDEIVAKGSVAVEGVSLTVAEVVRDRFSVALIPLTLHKTTLGHLRDGDRVNLEADLIVRSAREVHEAARLVVSRTVAALPWAGELRGPGGVEKAGPPNSRPAVEWSSSTPIANGRRTWCSPDRSCDPRPMSSC